MHVLVNPYISGTLNFSSCLLSIDQLGRLINMTTQDMFGKMSLNLSQAYLKFPLSPTRLYRNQEGRQILAEEAVRLLSFRMRSFRVMGNQPFF